MIPKMQKNTKPARSRVPKPEKSKNTKNRKDKYRLDESDESDENDSDYEKRISKEDIDFSIPKPGPHAKADEWRKWKLMKRSIREQRLERRLIKRQRLEAEQTERVAAEVEMAKPKEKGRNFTLSIAVPGSIIGKVQSKELKTYVSGQIARAATLYCVDEIIVYNEYAVENNSQNEYNQQLIKILEYLECPQYLRKALFPPHKHLEYVGLLNPLEAPHHFRIQDDWEYREGVVTDIPSKDNKGSWVDIGLLNKIQVDKKLKPGVRVTVKKDNPSSGKLRGLIVSPETPRTQNGTYWGYQVRYADSFRKILNESSFDGGYDLKIAINNKNLSFDHIKELPSANHVLVVFGGIQGVEAAIEADEKLKANKLEQIFKYVCESPDNKNDFGSRSIRLEESLLMCLGFIRPKLLQSTALVGSSAATNENLTESNGGDSADSNTDSDDSNIDLNLNE